MPVGSDCPDFFELSLLKDLAKTKNIAEEMVQEMKAVYQFGCFSLCLRSLFGMKTSMTPKACY